MNVIVIIGIIVILAYLVIHFYRIRNDIDRCCNCPYSNSLHCHRCRRESGIRVNRYNRVKN